MKHLTEMVEQHKRGNSNGIYAVCSAHPLGLEAAIRYAHAHQTPLLIEAPSNQVDQFGGYTGMTPADFHAFVCRLAESLGFAATAAHVGERAQVIVDGIEETEDGAELIGHAWFQAPDSDGAVHLDASEASVGDILTVEFTDSFCYELIGHVVE